MPEVPDFVPNCKDNFDFNQNVAVNKNFNRDKQDNIQEQRELRDDIMKKVDNVLGEEEIAGSHKIEINDHITCIRTKAPEILDEQFLRQLNN